MAGYHIPVIALLSGLLVGVMLTGAVLFAFGFYAGARWEMGRSEPPAPRMAVPPPVAVARYTPPVVDTERFCARTDWCAGYLGHPGKCFTSELGERPPSSARSSAV